MERTEAGTLLAHVLDLDLALEKGISIPWSEIGADDFAVLRVIESERQRYVKQKQEQRR